MRYLRQMGLTDRFAGERPLEMSVAETASGERALERMIEVGRHLKENDGAEAVVMGCAGMRGAGSNTLVTENAFVPASHALSLTDLRLGKGPGGTLHRRALYRTLFFFYAPLCFAAPIFGAAQGAYAFGAVHS